VSQPNELLGYDANNQKVFAPEVTTYDLTNGYSLTLTINYELYTDLQAAAMEAECGVARFAAGVPLKRSKFSKGET